jgi:hypothetical protein
MNKTQTQTQKGTTMQQYTVYTYKQDRRYKTGERLVSTEVWCDHTPAGTEQDLREVALQALSEPGLRVEVVPTTKQVRNLMSGLMVEIPHDTPRACDPSSELYWSM